MKKTRRRWFQTAVAATAACSIGSLVQAEEAEETRENLHQLPPKDLLNLLQEGNRRFASGEIRAPRRGLDRVNQTASRQTPFAAFLGCADSRVPIEILFDQGFGDLFVTRIAGNVATTENIASLEFGTQVLGAKVIYVLGHTSCGAVAATLKRDAVPGQISSLFQHIRPAVRHCRNDLEKAIRENVKMQAQILAEASPVIAARVSAGDLAIAGGVYNLVSGLVEPVDLELQ